MLIDDKDGIKTVDDDENIDDVIIDDNDEPDAGDDAPVDTPIDDDEDDGKPLTVRESLKKALEEDKAKQANEDKDPEDKTKKPEAKKINSAIENAVKDTKPDTKTKDETGTELKAPTSWSKEAKAAWANLDSHTKAAIAKREKEISDGFNTLNQEKARFSELDQVLTPRREAIKNFGASEAQIVNNLFLWMEGLTGPNKLQVFRQLGQNFKIDVSKLVEPAQNTDSNTDPNAQNTTTTDPVLLSRLEAIENDRKAENERRQREESQRAADYVNSWAQDKPHFQTVRSAMFALLSGGIIPLKNGAHDLDAAYEAAIRATPAVFELYQQEQKEKAEAEAAANKEKMEKVRLAKLAKAKKANVSVKSSAGFVAGSDKPKQKSNGAGGPVSVRDSIKAALKEAQN